MKNNEASPGDRFSVTRTSLTTDQRLRPLGHKTCIILSMLIVGIENTLAFCYVNIKNDRKHITTTTPNTKPNPNVTVWLA